MSMFARHPLNIRRALPIIGDEPGWRGSVAFDRVGNRESKLKRSIGSFESEIGFRDLLLEEIIHRTKNTLQSAVALLGKQADSTSDLGIRAAILGVQKQVLTLSQTHDRFFRSTYSTGASLSLRVGEICSSMCESLCERAGEITLAFNVTEVHLLRHQEICLSLLLQELVTST